MYEAYCDGRLLYADGVEEVILVNPKLTLETNYAGEFEFEIYPTHPMYSEIERMTSRIEVFRDGVRIFRGRVLTEEMGWFNQKKITCEGELAYLNDSVIRPYDWESETYTTFRDFLDVMLKFHNADVGDDEDKKFYVGDVTVTTEYGFVYIGVSNANYESTWKNIKSKLIEEYGGYISVRYGEDGKKYIDYLKEPSTLSRQIVEFGSNILDLSHTISGEDICTVVVPLGATKDDGLRLSLLDLDETIRASLGMVSGQDWLDSKITIDGVPVTEKYGRIVKPKEWDYIVSPETLLSKAQEYLTTSAYLSETIEVTAVDLARLDASIEAFDLGTHVRIVSKPHGIDREFLVSKLEINLTKPDSDKLTLGETFQSLSIQTVVQTQTMAIVQGDSIETLKKINQTNITVAANKKETDESLSSHNDRISDLEKRMSTAENNLSVLTALVNDIVKGVKVLDHVNVSGNIKVNGSITADGEITGSKVWKAVSN